jgi:hypothetical protein
MTKVVEVEGTATTRTTTTTTTTTTPTTHLKPLGHVRPDVAPARVDADGHRPVLGTSEHAHQKTLAHEARSQHPHLQQSVCRVSRVAHQ